MKNTAEMILDLCAERNISVARLERECGFSNGYIKSRLKSGTLPPDRIRAVCDFFGISYTVLAPELFGGSNLSQPDRDIVDFLASNPTHRDLVDRVLKVSSDDIEFIRELLSRVV